jgi:hypothetical protein
MMTTVPFETDPRLPVVIGVTGHRDLRPGDIESLRQAVAEVIQEISALAPSSPLLLLSSLAEGADRLVAETALRFGARLVVPLPMPPVDYETDFTPESVAEFRRLVSQSSACFEVETPTATHSADFREPGRARDERYRRAGAWVAVHCHVLLALWDGDTDEKIGGTNSIVRLRLEGGQQLHDDAVGPLDPIETGPVVHVVTPRATGAKPVGTPFSRRTLHPALSADHGAGLATDEVARDKQFVRLLADTERFNRGMRFLSTSLWAKLAIKSETTSGLLRDADLQDLPSIIALADRRFAIADAMGLQFQRKSRAILVSILWCSILGILALQLYLELWRKPFLLAVYLGALVVTGVLSLWTNWRSYQDRHLEARALAEALRVQIIWWLTGVKNSPAEAYLRLQRPALEWVRSALRSTEIPVTGRLGAPTGERPPPSPAGAALANTLWVADQHTYFMNAAPRDARILRRLEIWSGSLFVSAIASAVSVIAWHQEFEREELLWLHHGILIWMAMAITLAAIVRGYLVWMVLAEQVQQYERMSVVFGLAGHRLGSVDRRNQEAQSIVLRELGLEALRENGWWLALHRARPIEMFRG